MHDGRVPTIVFVHAHPDDEASQTSGSMARAAAEGHRVVVVFATNGDHGEDPDDLAEGETVVDRRRREAQVSAEVLGVHRVAWLGYSDSGMTGWEQNEHPGSFHQADLDEAATRLAEMLDDEGADVVVGYDWHGGYGHPDHIQVHRVGLAAVWAAPDLARYPLAEGEEQWLVPKVYWSSWPRSRRRRFAEIRLAAGEITQEDYEAAAVSGTPDELLTMVDTGRWVDVKLAALRAHRSQIPEDWFMLRVDEDMREEVVGRESFYRVHSAVAVADDGDLFAGLG